MLVLAALIAGEMIRISEKFRIVGKFRIVA
jgi:hypothetical protein